MVEALRVLRTYCPFWERTVYELWNGQHPVIAANNYLRSDLTLGDSTLANKAYALLLFFRFLQRNSLDFFDFTERTVRPFILHFRNELSYRIRQFDADSQQINGSRKCLSHARASQVLTEVGWLFRWWGLISVSYRHPHYTRFRTKHSTALPDFFNIGIPRARRGFRDNHVLEPTEVEAIWHYLSSEVRPSTPRLLADNPSGPKRGWSPTKAAAWRSAQERYKEKLAWFHRQQMLWALFISSGMRRSEIPLLMVEDVRFYGEDLWLCLRTRKETDHLGKAKTGPRTVFIGWDSRIISAWQNWIRSRQFLLEKWTAETNQPRHEMFLTNRNGGPLTVDGLESLFASLNKRFQVFGGEFVEEQFSLHPHAIRHTVEALFEWWKIPRDLRQRHLGHKKPETTDLYGKVYRKAYREVLSNLELKSQH